MLLLVSAVGGLGLQVRADLRADVVADELGKDNFHAQADRWLPITRPLLWEWSRSSDHVRFGYAARTFVREDRSEARRWLESELRLNPSMPFPFERCESEWVSRLGLDSPEGLQSAIRLGLQNLDSRAVERQFNASFLATLLESRVAPQAAVALGHQVGEAPPARARALLGLFREYESHFPEVAGLKGLYEKNARAERREWGSQVLEKTVARELSLEAALAAFRLLDARQQTDALEYASGATPQVKQLLTRLADDPQDPCRGAAACVLEPSGGPRLRRMVEHDLGGLCRLDSLRAFDLVKRYPQSRYARACREYAAIRGDTYFANRDWDWAEPDRTARRPPSPDQEEARWIEWLTRYPDHPGADDAGFWLGRCLEWQGKRVDALRQFADLVAHPHGDDDLADAVRSRFVMVLDVGSTTDDLRAFLSRFPDHPMADAVRYALAVHLARAHDYAGALDLTVGLTPTKVAPPRLAMWEGPAFIQPGYYDQRRRWQNLRALGAPDTPQRRCDLAVAWSEPDSWRNGYLMLWQGNRASHFAYDHFSNDVGRSTVIPAGYRGAHPLAIALALLHPLAHDRAVDPALVEKTLALQVNLLVRCLDYPEAEAMVPLDGFPANVGRDSHLYQTKVSSYDTRPRAEIRRETEPFDWYARQALAIAHRLRSEYPHSVFALRVNLDLRQFEHDDDPAGPSPTAVAPFSWRALARDAVEYLRSLHF